ncbi:MAG: DUF86 domain-containing protein [Bacteroidales bacterium]|nr:DUF86 domain-containing protein [Bacteroidales bacterium]
MFKQNDIANLNNIIWAIEKIENSLKSVTSIEEFAQNEEKFDSIIVKLMSIGESADKLSQKLKSKFPSIDWMDMYRMRNIITHSYHSLDESIVWDIALNELPNDKFRSLPFFLRLKRN